MSARQSQGLRFNAISLLALCLFCVAGCLRFSSLTNLPGINADEADMGVSILQMLHGQPYSLHSHTGQLFNPLFVISESALLKFFSQNFYLLRLPAATFAAAGIVVLMYAYGRIFSDWNTALALGVVTACFPLHLIFSRLAWDPTFLFFWTPILLYLSLRLVTQPRRRNFWLMGLCILLAMWTHATAFVFILAMLGALCWVQRDATAAWVKNHSPSWLTALLPRQGAIFFGVCAIITALSVWVAKSILMSRVLLLGDMTIAMTARTLLTPASLILHLRLIGDMLTSYRGLAYVAGYPNSSTFEVIGWLAELLLIGGWIRLALSRSAADRLLASLLLFYFLLLILMAGFLHLQIAGNQRYVMPLVVLLPLIVVRSFPHPAWLMVLSMVMLGEYWCCFERPTLECRYVAGTEFTFRTGLREPKAQAAEIISRFSQHATAVPAVYTDLYWLQQPLQFLLFGQANVRNDWPGAQVLKAGDFVTAYCGEAFLDSTTAELITASRPYDSYTIANQSGVQEVVVLHIVK